MIYNIDCRHDRQIPNRTILIFPKPHTGIFLLLSSLVRDHLDIASNYFFFDKLYIDRHRNHILRIVSAVLYPEHFFTTFYKYL